MSTLEFEKYEGLGNDFLLAIGARGDFEITAELAVGLCDRHRGIGADGLIALDQKDGILVMELHNADGSVAETSGNGLRCAALAAIDAGMVSSGSFEIKTMAGLSAVEVIGTSRDQSRTVRVDMGEVVTTAQLHSPLEGWRAWHVNVGNPHLVLFGGKADEVELARFGRRLDEITPGGLNVELIELIGGDVLRLEVWERGVGLTLSCGTGSVAATAAAYREGFVSEVVEVVNPGGSCRVQLRDIELQRMSAHLAGPARHVAHVTVDDRALNLKVTART